VTTALSDEGRGRIEVGLQGLGTEGPAAREIPVPTSDFLDVGVQDLLAGEQVVIILMLSGRRAVATITIRNLDESVKTRLRIRAASHDRSMEEEARAILRTALQVGEAGGGLGTLIHKRFMAAGGAELRQPERKQRPRKAAILR